MLVWLVTNMHNTRLNEYEILERGISHWKRVGDGSGIELALKDLPHVL